MALVPKIDPNKIFASNAPTQDKPAAFDNYEKGMDETRKNLGRPTIKQLNYLHQTADQKILWVHQNGAALPHDASIEYAENAVTLKDGELQKKQGAGWVILYLGKSNNLDDVPSKTTARTNLDVYSKIEVDNAISSAIPPETPDATETTAGKAKIATTAIAQAGTNDADFITAKKLLDFIKSNVIKNDFIDVTSSRIRDVTYTNPSSSSYLNIRISATIIGTGSMVSMFVNDKLGIKTTISGGGAWGETIFLLVPPLGTYRMEGISTVVYWGEA